MVNTDSQLNKNRWLIFFAVVTMTFMACLDSSIVNVALPVMSKELSVSMVAIEWVVTSYLIVISATILIFGRLGDIKGKVKIFRFGVVLFTLGSLLCSVTNSLPVLVAARVLQGIGAAATMATSQGIVTQVFPAKERGVALGAYGAFVALGVMVGPPLGGVIVSYVRWNYIFLINVPLGIASIILGMIILPKSSKNITEKLDLKGALLFSVFVVLVFGSLLQGQDVGLNQPLIILGFVISLMALIYFVIVERKVEAPLLELKIFENRLFSINIFCAFISFVALSCMNIIQPFYFQDSLKQTPALTGLFMMASPLILSIVSPISGYLSDKIGSEVLTFLGLIFMSIGLFLMSSLTGHSNLVVVVLFLAILSAGNGLFQSPNNSIIMSTVSKDKLGIVGSVNALVRNLAMVFGVSVSTTILYGRMSHIVGYRVVDYIRGRDYVFIYAMQYVYICASIVCILGILLTGIRLYNSSKRKKEIDALL